MQADVSKPYSTFFKLIPISIRRRFYSAVLLIGFVGILEIFSLSALLAFFSVGLGEAGGRQSNVISEWLGSFDLKSNSGFLLVVALSMFVLKAGVILWVGRHSYQTAIAAKRYFQNQLFHRFLHIPFRDQIEKRSADWVRSITIDCNALEGRFFMPVLVLLGEIIPAICVCCVLLLVNAMAFFISIGIFAGVGVALFLATHSLLVRLGQDQQTAEGHIVQSTQQAFQGLRELTIYGLQGWSQTRFEIFTAASSRAVNEALFIGLLPRFVFEVAIYLSLGIVFLIYALQGAALTQVIGEFAVFGAAAMRLLPSVSKVISHLQSLKHARPAVVAVIDHLRSPEQALIPPDESVTPIVFDSLAMRDVGFDYGHSLVFRELNIDIFSGDRLAVVGMSGAGKSTLINLVLGLLDPTHGRINVNGAPLAGRERDWWSCVAYVPQEPFLMDASPLANVMLGSTEHSIDDVARARELIKGLDLPDGFQDSTDTIGESGARLSGGQRQRLAIARALYRDPQVLILDEATSAMDVQTQSRVLDLVALYMKGRTILMITHRPETRRYCNKVLTLPGGHLMTIESEQA